MMRMSKVEVVCEVKAHTYICVERQWTCVCISLELQVWSWTHGTILKTEVNSI